MAMQGSRRRRGRAGTCCGGVGSPGRRQQGPCKPTLVTRALTHGSSTLVGDDAKPSNAHTTDGGELCRMAGGGGPNAHLRTLHDEARVGRVNLHTKFDAVHTHNAAPLLLRTRPYSNRCSSAGEGEGGGEGRGEAAAAGTAGMRTSCAALFCGRTFGRGLRAVAWGQPPAREHVSG